jgi:integrase
MAKKLEYTLEAVNQRLTDGRVKSKVFQRGGMLYLQATLPPKPGSDRPVPYQQRISLGVPANQDGFRSAEQEARLLGAELVSNKFDWSKYLKPDRLPETKPIVLWVEEFRVRYLETNSLKETTWENDWVKIYKRLPQNEPLTKELLLDFAHRTGRNTRNRKETCKKLQHLANFAGLEVSLLQLQGNYGPSKVRDRDIPSDEDIALQWTKIPNPAWRWVFGVMAAFGLRDHEVFFCEWTDEGLLVTKGKTGPRLVFQPLYQEWVDGWNLRTIQRPNVQDVDLVYARNKLGDKIARQFRRYDIPFTPYSLRHAFGIRASVTFELPVTTAAALMGHSPQIHLQRYHKHIQLKSNQAAAKRVMERSDRPKPPVITRPDV